MRADLIELIERCESLGAEYGAVDQTYPEAADALLLAAYELRKLDALASLSSPQESVAWRNEEAGFVEFVNDDVPYIVREIDSPVAILLDMTTRNIIGYRVYDPSPVVPVAAKAEAEGWEAFTDDAYYNMWCVRKIGSTAFGEGFHVASEEEARALIAELSPTCEGEGT